MRSEQEMYELILGTARDDERVRAVLLSSSRANPDAPRDFFQDYDIVYVVTEVESFKRDPGWIGCFGELMILQLPDDMSDPPGKGGHWFTYLMQFMDGNRIDLGLFPIDHLDEIEADTRTVVLLDKDGIVPARLTAGAGGYLPKPPTAKAYADCCNEFWWVSPYVAKGLWREEIAYAKCMAEIVHEQLMKMLGWYVGVRTRFTGDPGKYGKYLNKYLEPELWELFLATYAGADYDHTWESLSAMGRLFRRTAVEVAQGLGFAYPHGDDERVSAHLEHVRRLPKDAAEMY